MNNLQVVEEHCVRSEAVPEGAVDCTEERMPVWVTKKGVRISFAESLRIPGEGSSSQG